MEEFINIIAAVINTLDRVSVPVSLTEQIGIPVYNSANALKDVYKKMREKMEQDKKSEQPSNDEVGEIQFVDESEEAEENPIKTVE